MPSEINIYKKNQEITHERNFRLSEPFPPTTKENDEH